MGAGCCGKSKVVEPQPEHEPLHSIYRSESPPVQQEDYVVKRFYKIAVSTNNPSKLIEGYFDEPLVSLEEALQPFNGKIGQLSSYIKEAKTNCHYPSEHNLTRDESAAIYIYTMQWHGKSLYDHLQAAWGSGDRSKMKPWFKYLKLFKSAFDKLPKAKHEIWQGTSYDERLKDALTSKSSTLYSSMGSCSGSPDEILDYLQNNFGTQWIIIGYKSVDAKSVVGYTVNQSQEFIIWPGMKLGVLNVHEDKITGLVTIHLSTQVGK